MNRYMLRAVYAMFAVTMAGIALYPLARTAASAEPANAKPVTVSADSALISRGEYLAKLGDCAGCHTATKSAAFAGGLNLNAPFGAIYSTNITPDPKSGIGRYSYADFERALRDGVAPGGKHLYPAMPYPSFSKITDEDMHALYAYFMHGVQAVSSQPPETKLPFPFNQRWGLALWNAAFVPHKRFTPDDDRNIQWNRGAYIVQSIGHCGACHTPRGSALQERGYDETSGSYLTGGLNDNWFAPNLTGDSGSGLGRLSEHDIMSFLKTGHGRDLHVVAFGAMVPVVEHSTQYFNDVDLQAVAHYLKSLPARNVSGAYTPDAAQARQANSSVKTGDVGRPGAGLYMSFCVKCHQADGRGEPLKFPALQGNPAVLAPDTTSLIRILLEGGRSPTTLTGPREHKMHAYDDQFTDTEIARVLTFVRNSWGNQASPVTTRDVSGLRAELAK